MWFGRVQAYLDLCTKKEYYIDKGDEHVAITHHLFDDRNGYGLFNFIECEYEYVKTRPGVVHVKRRFFMDNTEIEGESFFELFDNLLP